MLVGLGIVRLKTRLSRLRTAVKPHRYKAVWYAGRGVDDNSRLEALTIHPSVSRFLLSSNAPGVWHAARSIPVLRPYPYCLAWDSLRAEHGSRGFRLCDSSLLPPSAVRSRLGIKREESRTSGRLRDSSIFDEVSSHRYVVSCTASIDTAAKLAR